MVKEDLMYEDGKLMIENGKWRMKDGELWIEDGQLRFKNTIMPHWQLIHIFLVILCCEPRYFEDIINL